MLKVLISLALVALCAAQNSKLPTPIPFPTPKPVLTTVPVRNPMYLPATQFQQGHFVNQQNPLLYPIRNPVNYFLSPVQGLGGGWPYAGPIGSLPFVNPLTGALPIGNTVGGLTGSLPVVGSGISGLPIVGNTVGIRHPVKYVPQATTFTTTTMRKPMLQTMMPQNLNLNLNPQRNYVQNYGTPYYGSNYVYPTSSEFGNTGYSYPTNYGYPYYGQSYGTPYYGHNYAYQSSPVLGTYGYSLQELPTTTTFAPPLETMA